MSFIEKKIKKNYNLTLLNTFRIRAYAQYFVTVKNRTQLLAALNWAKARRLPLLILAGGSNVLITAKKIKGLVLKFSGEQCSVKDDCLTAWAGASLAKLVRLARLKGLSGLEWASGIPGQLGGAVRGNAGAYGSEIAELVKEAEVYDLKQDRFVKLNKKQCGFGYRDSIFKAKSNLIIIEIKLKLRPGKGAEIRKLELKNLRRRIAVQPKLPSAGCVFKNLPYSELLKQNKNLALDLKAKGLIKAGKIGAGYFIDQLGLKGFSRGQAKISQTHANFMVNSGQARAFDVIKLINLVKSKVKNKYKINLREEIQYFGN